MTESILISVLSLVGTLAGTFGGIVVSNRLTNYRISKLEDEVKKHNKVIERVYNLEKKSEISDEKFRTVNYRIEEIEKDIKK